MTLLIHEDTVKKEWIDYNGHMSEAFYVLVFGHATDDFLDRIGLDEANRNAHGVSAFTVEAHIRYLNQASEGNPLKVSTLLTDFDSKRARLFHTMRLGPGGSTLATEEVLLLSVDTQTGKVRPFDAAIQNNLDQLSAAQADQPRSKDLGRAIAL